MNSQLKQTNVIKNVQNYLRIDLCQWHVFANGLSRIFSSGCVNQWFWVSQLGFESWLYHLNCPCDPLNFCNTKIGKDRKAYLTERQFLTSCPQTSSIISPENLLELHVLRLHTRFTESEALRVGTHNLYFNSYPGDSDAY